MKRLVAVAATVACVAVALILAAFVGETSYRRFTYPHELSVMEGGFVAHAQMIASGQPIYGPPSAQFIPLLYTPLSHYASGGMMFLGLSGFAAVRLTSLAGIAIATIIGMVLARRATTLRWLWLSVPLLVIARYFDVQAFYDQGRPDNLMAAFCLMAVWALTLQPSSRLVPTFALAASLAVYTKQSAVVFILALLLLHVRVRLRDALLCLAAWLALSGLLFVVLDALTDGWFARYIVGVSGSHRLDLIQASRAALSELAGSFGITTLAVVVAAAALASRRWPRPETRQDVTRVVLLHAAIAAIAFVEASMLQPLVMKNVLVLYAVVGAAFLPVALDWGIGTLADRTHRELALTGAVLTLTLVMAGGVRDRAAFAVDRSSHPRQWRNVRQMLDAYGPPERTWTMLHASPWDQRPIRPQHVHLAALLDYRGGRFSQTVSNPLPSDLQERIATGFYAAILVPDWIDQAEAMIADHYEIDVTKPAVRLPALSGYGPGLERVWVPRQDVRPTTP